MHLLAPLALLSSLALPALAADSSSNSTKGSVFAYNPGESSDQQFVFALNIDQDSNDLYFHMASPAGLSWMGVGFGSQMKNSLMLIMYGAADEKSVTISPRLADGNSEPSWYDNVHCEVVTGDGLVSNSSSSGMHEENGAISVNGKCTGKATKWDTGSLDLTNDKQPFIFAVGPDLPFNSNSAQAGLRRHVYTGHFTMDMTKAVTSSASSPKPNDRDVWTTLNAGPATDTNASRDPAPVIHGFVMCLSYVIILPLGTLLRRAMHRIIGHIIVQCVGFVLTLMATAGGIVVSLQFNKSKNFRSAHQVIGILLLLAMVGQFGLGVTHHRIFKKERRATLLGKIHRYLGPAVIIIGIINAGIGFNFAGDGFLGRPFAAVVIIVALAFLAVRMFMVMRERRKKKAAAMGTAPYGGSEGYQQPQFGPGFGPGGAPPPPYGFNSEPAPAYPAGAAAFGHHGQDVPLQPYARPGYERQPSGVSTGESHPVEARPMV